MASRGKGQSGRGTGDRKRSKAAGSAASSSSSGHPAPALNPSHRLLWIACVLTVALAVARALIFFAPHRWFDVDPAVDPNPLRGLGPAGSLWIDAGLIAAAGLIHLGLWRARRTIRLLPLLLAGLPGVAILIHGWGDGGDGGDATLGLTWLAGALAAVSIYAALTSRAIEGENGGASTGGAGSTDGGMRLLRITVLALLLASAGPLLVRGFANVTFEHQQTIREFEAHKEQFLADRGWSAESASAKIFERRMRQAQPTGWFTSTNVFASLALALGLTWAGLAAASVTRGLRSEERERRSPAQTMLLSALAVAAGVALFMTGSMGAIGTCLIGAGVMAIAFMLLRAKSSPPSFIMRLAMCVPLAAVIAAIGAVIVRGAVLPESFGGDRSLLFRWHYMAASWRMWLDQPWLGVGPSGYQASYLLHRSPRSPEEVASAHNALLDWMTTLGVWGFAWVALFGMGLVKIGRGLVTPSPAQRDADETSASTFAADQPLPRVMQWSIAGGTLLAVGPSLFVELPSFLAVGDQSAILSRLAGALAYPLLAWLMARMLLTARPMVIPTILAAAATGLAVHAQIEMTPTQPGSSAWFALALAAAAAFAQTASRPSNHDERKGWSLRLHRGLAATAALVLVALALMTAIVFARPALQQEQWEAAAADALRPAAEALAERRAYGAENLMDARREAADRLGRAYEAWPARPWPLIAAARQLERAAAMARANENQHALLMKALLMADLAADGTEEAAVAARPMAASIAWRLAELDIDSAMRDEAIRRMEAVVALDPHGLNPRRQLAEMYDRAGRTADAIDAYERTLEIDANFELDPLKQLPLAERARIEARLAELRAILNGRRGEAQSEDTVGAGDSDGDAHPGE